MFSLVAKTEVIARLFKVLTWYRCQTIGTIASKINVTAKGIRLSKKLQLTSVLSNEI